jgi:hypothetical protein
MGLSNLERSVMMGISWGRMGAHLRVLWKLYHHPSRYLRFVGMDYLKKEKCVIWAEKTQMFVQMHVGLIVSFHGVVMR